MVSKFVWASSTILISIAMLSGCATEPNVDTLTKQPTPSATSANPDVLAPIDFALERSIGEDVTATTAAVQQYFFLNPDSTTFPSEQVVNRNPGAVTVTVTANPDGSFLVTGQQNNGEFKQEQTVPQF